MTGIIIILEFFHTLSQLVWVLFMRMQEA